MAKRDGKKKSFQTSYQRARKGISEARVLTAGQSIRVSSIEPNSKIETTLVRCEISPESNKETKIKQSFKDEKEELLREARDAETKAFQLSESVEHLYQDTRGGISTSKEEEFVIINEPRISGEDVFNAIYLGIKAWPLELLRKER